MSEKVYRRDAAGNLMKMPGWFSWRHEGREQHDQARENYLGRCGPAARQDRAEVATPGKTQHTQTRGHKLGRCSCKQVTA